MVKIIFSDFDNTLMDYYSSYNYFDEYRLNVLRKLKKKGIILKMMKVNLLYNQL